MLKHFEGEKVRCTNLTKKKLLKKHVFQTHFSMDKHPITLNFAPQRALVMVNLWWELHEHRKNRTHFKTFCCRTIRNFWYSKIQIVIICREPAQFQKLGALIKAMIEISQPTKLELDRFIEKAKIDICSPRWERLNFLKNSQTFSAPPPQSRFWEACGTRVYWYQLEDVSKNRSTRFSIPVPISEKWAIESRQWQQTILPGNGPSHQSALNCWETSKTSIIANIPQEEPVSFPENQTRRLQMS